MVAAWPGSVPFIDNLTAYRESGPVANVISTPMDAGPAKSRRRFTAAVRRVSGETDILAAWQVDLFKTFWEDTIADGALPFTATNPRTGVTETYRRASGTEEGYQIIFLKNGLYRIALDLEQQP